MMLIGCLQGKSVEVSHQAPISVMSRGKLRRGVNLGPRDKGLATLFPVVLRVGASGLKQARRAAP